MTAQRMLDYVRTILDGEAAGQWGPDDALARLREMFDQGMADASDYPRPFAELAPTGLLWLINRQVFHPRGHALSIALDDDGIALGWDLEGDGTEPWRFADEAVELERMQASLATFASVRKSPL